MVTFKCLICGKESIAYGKRKGKFCSYDCYHKGHKKGLTSHKKRKYNYFKCQYCGRKFKREKRSKNHWKKNPPKYCNKECYNNAQKTGRTKRMRTDQTQRMKEKKNAVCLICKYKRFIELAHFNPSSKKGNYSKENIMFLCPNHHRLFDNNLLNDKEKEIVNKWHIRTARRRE